MRHYTFLHFSRKLCIAEVCFFRQFLCTYSKDCRSEQFLRWKTLYYAMFINSMYYMQSYSKQSEVFNFYGQQLLKLRVQQYYTMFSWTKYHYTMRCEYNINKFRYRDAEKHMNMLSSMDCNCHTSIFRCDLHLSAKWIFSVIYDMYSL